MKRTIILAIGLTLLVTLLAGCGTVAPKVDNAFTYAAKQGDNLGVFMVVKNTSSKDDALVSAKTTVSDRAELHTMVANPAGGMMMQQVQSIPIPANGQVELKSGSLHLMVFGLKKDVNVGETFPVTLHTQNGSDVKIQVAVKAKN